jgi:hypothetical protein
MALQLVRPSSGRDVVHMNVSTSMQAHHIAVNLESSRSPSGENGLEVGVIEKDVIEHDVWHRYSRRSFLCAVKLFRDPLS